MSTTFLNLIKNCLTNDTAFIAAISAASDIKVASGAIAGTNLTLTLSDASTVVVDLTSLATDADLASNANGLGASLIGVEDAGGNFTATNLEAVLAELFAGIAGGGTNATATAAGIAELATDAEVQAATAAGTSGPLVVTPGNMDNMLTTLIGTTSGQYDLDTFTGDIIPDDSSVKAALQALESQFLTQGTETAVAATASLGEELPVNVSGGAFTITAPTGTTAGQRFALFDSRATSSTNNITVDFGAQLLHGSVGSDTLNEDAAYAEYLYYGGAIGWRRSK